MIFKNLKSHLANYFRSQKQIQQDKDFLNGLLTEDRMEEASAYAFLLCDLARSDGIFDEQERTLIQSVLAEIFPKQAPEVERLIKTAEHYLDLFRGPSEFVRRIKEEYSPEEREKLYAVIDKVISADNSLAPSEEYLRAKFKSALE